MYQHLSSFLERRPNNQAALSLKEKTQLAYVVFPTAVLNRARGADFAMKVSEPTEKD